MSKHCSNVCKFCLCLATESTNSARIRTIVTAALQRQYLQMELIFSITLVYSVKCVISGFHCEVAENCALLSYYTVSNGVSS